ncbi:class I SAM-dependent methyltransferase [Streptomyces sp. NPDC054887]
MPAPGSDRYGERMFRPQETGEDDRIDLGALAYDDVTFARLRELGVGPGWNCLDVGAGTGTIARRLLRGAGAARVLAVDRDVRFLTADPVPGLEVATLDITAPDFAPGLFDLVHARFVLMHLPDPETMISRLAALVAPGGVLVLSDAIDLTTAVEPPAPYTRVMRAMWEGLRATIGTDVSWVPRYPQLLRSAGLRSVAAEVYVPPLVPGSPISRFWADTWQRAREAMVATGLLDDGGLDEAVQGLATPDWAGLSPGMITVWGRHPAEPPPEPAHRPAGP